MRRISGFPLDCVLGLREAAETGRSVVASAPALGAGDRRFESCRPDMEIQLDDADPRAPYEQIRAGIAAQVDAGTLWAGDRLPTVRRLAEDLGVAANTVARAYRELEASGVIETRGRAGSFVMGDRVEREAKEAAVAYLERTKALGLSAADAVALVRQLEQHPVRSS